MNNKNLVGKLIMNSLMKRLESKKKEKVLLIHRSSNNSIFIFLYSIFI